jgi:rsbT co-antagonist protein RsbR
MRQYLPRREVDDFCNPIHADVEDPARAAAWVGICVEVCTVDRHRHPCQAKVDMNMVDTALAVEHVHERGTSAELLSTYGIDEADLERIARYGKLVTKRLDVYGESFYAWLSTQPEFARYFGDRAKLERVKRLQLAYWEEFFRGRVDGAYIEQRQLVGNVHARIGLSLPAYFAAMNYSLRIFLDDLYDGSLEPVEYAAAARSITKLMNFDTAIVVDTYANLTTATIRSQSDALMQMSTPVTSIWRDILMLPIVGLIDSGRAQSIMTAMLKAIAATQSRVIIMDISGVGVVDTAVANHLIKITRATKMMGCECTISGVSAAIAQTVVELGIDVGNIKTTATLQDALAEAFKKTGAGIRDAR